MQDLRPITCCFSGYRIEKMPFGADAPEAEALKKKLADAVARAHRRGCTRFFTGMSTGFDLWAAMAVLEAKKALPLRLCCAIPFDDQARAFAPFWKKAYNQALVYADEVYTLSRAYHAGCYAARNRFMVEASARLICYYDGLPGGTAQTVRMAQKAGLLIDNLAEEQLSLISH